MKIEELTKEIAEKAGLSQEQAQKAAEAAMAYFQKETSLKERLHDLAEGAQETIGNLAEGAKDAFGNVAEGAKSIFGNVSKTVGGFFGGKDNKEAEAEKKDADKDEAGKEEEKK